MSLVNLSHVCSHLQNASLARLGLTSIPYTRLHLSLALLLQKEGFLSQVKLGGPSPPASCFPPGLREDQAITAHPHADRSLLTPESALQRMVAEGWNAARLRDEGFDEESVDFALEQREKSNEQLQRERWDDVAADFLIKYMWKAEARQDQDADLSNPETWTTREQLQLASLEEEAIEILLQHQTAIADAYRDVLKWHSGEEASTRTPALVDFELRSRLKRDGLPLSTLQYFAGSARFRTERDLRRDGFSLSAMGLEIPNQPYTPLPPVYADPRDLETEGVVTQANRASRRLWLGLKYWDGMPVLRKARMISKPTKRYYLSWKEIGDLVRGGRAAKGQVRPLAQVGEIMAVTTELGILEARECVQRRTGGMVLCRIW